MSKRLNGAVRKHGRVLGHRFGGADGKLLGYVEARKRIYIPAYHWVLEHRMAEEVRLLRELLEEQPVVLLDYETNEDIEDVTQPLSHAGLVKGWCFLGIVPLAVDGNPTGGSCGSLRTIPFTREVERCRSAFCTSPTYMNEPPSRGCHPLVKPRSTGTPASVA